MDIYIQSRLLLERLANSIYERKPRSFNQMYFTSTEVDIVQVWLNDILEQVTKETEK